MQVLHKSWADDYLDYSPSNPGDVIVAVAAWFVVARVDDQYIVRQRSMKLLLNYIREIGLFRVIHKIRSRLKEKGRNDKYVSIGIGRVIHPSARSKFGKDDFVVFVATNHPACVNRICIDYRFTLCVNDLCRSIRESQDLLYYASPPLLICDDLKQYFGWTPLSGRDVNEALVKKALRLLKPQIDRILRDGDPPPQRLPIRSHAIQNRVQIGKRIQDNDGRVRAVLFGLGNYAKTIIIPNMSTEVELLKIHEIDPTQIGPIAHWNIGLDTSDSPRSDEVYDVYFIASYHHTHTDIALHALERGAYAVVEKPLATSLAQLMRLKCQLAQLDKPRLFTCFQKRYLDFNNWIFQDLAVSEGFPVNYHCIVYEIPLPNRHWYNWPSSRSRLTSNGCHWIDHFFFLNGYNPVTRKSVNYSKKNGTYVVLIELQNGALFSMTLTDVGSQRLGVRDYIELRANGATVRLLDASRYESENNSRTLRRRTINRLHSYRRMYGSISDRIVSGSTGDPVNTLLSTQITLELEDELRDSHAA